VLSLEQRVPEWLLRMATPSGVADFEQRHAIQLPGSLQEYYRSLRLISFLHAAWDVLNIDVFLSDLPDQDQPEIRTWQGKPHVVIGEFPHSGTFCGTELTGDNQYMCWEGVFGKEQPVVTLSDWLQRLTESLLGDNG
jgi:hypothetical protein